MASINELINDLKRFSAGSANDENYKHLWFKNAKLFIEQLNSFLKLIGYKSDIINADTYYNETTDTLGQYLRKNQSDKSTSHNYHFIYSYIFNKLGINNKLNILEVGLGTNNPSLVSSMGNWGRPGASLYAWEEYLPNSDIYGLDIDKDILFNSGRIKTRFVDQLDINTFDNIKNEFNIKYDLIIDDGLHSIGANLNTLLFALENVNDDGWIVIEDIHPSNYDNWFIIDYLMKQNKHFECQMVKCRSSYIYVVHKIKV